MIFSFYCKNFNSSKELLINYKHFFVFLFVDYGKMCCRLLKKKKSHFISCKFKISLLNIFKHYHAEEILEKFLCEGVHLQIIMKLFFFLYFQLTNLFFGMFLLEMHGVFGEEGPCHS